MINSTIAYYISEIYNTSLIVGTQNVWNTIYYFMLAWHFMTGMQCAKCVLNWFYTAKFEITKAYFF